MTGRPFTIICVPCSQFFNQEVPDPDQVRSFVLNKLGSSGGSFVVLERTDINGERMHPLYHYLKRNSELYRPHRNKAMPIAWNYGKFLVGPTGDIISFKGPAVSPLDLEDAIHATFPSRVA